MPPPDRGRFPQLRDRNNLWGLLVLITARKAVNLAKHERRQKRGGGRAAAEPTRPVSADSSGGEDPVRTENPAQAHERPFRVPEMLEHLMQVHHIEAL